VGPAHAPAVPSNVKISQPDAAGVRSPADLQALVPIALEVLAKLGFQITPPAAAPPAGDELVDVDALAAALGCSKWTVYRLAAKGRIPSVCIGRKRRFELDAVIAALRTQPAAASASTRRSSQPRSTSLPPVKKRPHASASPAPAASSGRATAPLYNGGADHAERLRAAVDATRRLGERE
jgi:excisionase family DNA binding protein